MKPTKEEMLEVIQEKVWKKRNVWSEYVWDFFIKEVMIWDVLEYINYNVAMYPAKYLEFIGSNTSKNDGAIYWSHLFLQRWEFKRLSIEHQDENLIEYIYNLVK